MNKVYCKNCRFCTNHLNLIQNTSDACKKFPFYKISYFEEVKKYRLCQDINRNNDCKDFETKLSHKFYKYIKNLYNNFK